MKITPPNEAELQTLLGAAYPTWLAMRAQVEALYEMEAVWNTGGKAGGFVLRYRRGGKTLCTLCAKESEADCMIVFGAQERDKAEPLMPLLPHWIREAYAAATTYHDGKWVLFPLPNAQGMAELAPLLRVKRRPTRG